MGFLKSLVCAAVVLVIMPALAGAQTKNPKMFAIFCDGPYALCIKAPCSKEIVVSGGKQTVECSCTVQHGWSMGPAACVKRMPVTGTNGVTKLMSTYSNFYNGPNQNMTCKGSSQQWANCYGAPCVTDPSDPTRATCTCPVRTGDMITLGGGCDKNRCGEMWSAARPNENEFANNNFYAYMTKNYPYYPVNPPAKVCGAI